MRMSIEKPALKVMSKPVQCDNDGLRPLSQKLLEKFLKAYPKHDKAAAKLSQLKFQQVRDDFRALALLFVTAAHEPDAFKQDLIIADCFPVFLRLVEGAQISSELLREHRESKH